MAQKLQVKLDHVVGEIESSPGTAETLEAADFNCRCHDITYTLNYGLDDENSKHATGDHTEGESVPGATSATISFWTYCTWGGAVGTPPAWWEFAKACGAVQTTHGAVGLSLAPEKSYDEKTMTITGYRLQRGATPAALSFPLVGAAGNASISCDGIGAPWKVNFEFTGKIADLTDVANGSLLALTSPDTTVSEKLLSNTFSVGGTNLSIGSFSLDFGNVIGWEEDQSDATGYKHAVIEERHPRFSCNPYMDLAANYDVDAIFRASTVGAISLTTAAASPHFTISAPRAQLMPPSVSDRNGTGGWDLTYKLLRNTAGSDAADKERAWRFLQGATA